MHSLAKGKKAHTHTHTHNHHSGNHLALEVLPDPNSPCSVQPPSSFREAGLSLTHILIFLPFLHSSTIYNAPLNSITAWNHVLFL